MTPYTGEVVPLQPYDGKILPLDENDKKNLLQQQAKTKKLEDEITSRNPIQQEKDDPQLVAPPVEEPSLLSKGLHAGAEIASRTLNPLGAAADYMMGTDMYGGNTSEDTVKGIGGGLVNAVKNTAGALAGGSEVLNKGIDNIQNPVLHGLASGVNHALSPVGSMIPEGTEQKINEDVPGFTPENKSQALVAGGTELAAGMVGPGKLFKVTELKGLPRLFANLAKYASVNAGGIAAMDPDTKPFITGENAEYANLLGRLALDQNGNYSERHLKNRLNVLGESMAIAKPLELGARGIAGAAKFIHEMTLGKLLDYKNMAPKDKQAAKELVTELIDVTGQESPDQMQQKYHEVAQHMRQGAEVKIPSDIPGVDSVDYKRPTMEAFAAGGGNKDSFDLARARGLQSSAISRGLPKLEASAAQPSLKLEKATDQTREVFGGKDSAEKAKQGILASADEDVGRYNSEVRRKEDLLDTASKDTTDLVKNDPFLGPIAQKADGNIQLGLRQETNKAADTIVTEHNKAKGLIEDTKNQKFDAIPDTTPADMENFNKVHEQIKEYLPSDIQKLIEKNDGSYGYLKKQVLPELSAEINDLYNSGKGRIAGKLVPLRDEISKGQLASLTQDGNLGTAKAAQEADRYFKQEVAPYRQGASDKLSDIQQKAGFDSGTGQPLRSDDLTVDSRKVLKSTLDDPDQIEHTKRVLSLIQDDKTKTDYILGNIAEEVSDTIASKGIQGLDAGKIAKSIRPYTQMLPPVQAKRLETFVNDLNSKKLNIDQMTTELEGVKKTAKEAHDDIYKGELRKFFDEDHLPQGDPDQVFGSYLDDPNGLNKVKQLMNRLKSRNDPDLGDGLKSTYAKLFKSKIYRGGEGAAGEKNINQNTIKNIGEGSDKLLEVGDLINGKDSTVMKLYRGLLNEAGESASFRSASKTSSSDINQFNKGARGGIDLVITQVFGQLNRWGSRLRAVAGRAVSDKSSRQQNLDAIAAIYSDPYKAADLIDSLGAEAKNNLSYEGKRRIFQWGVMNGVYKPEQEQYLLGEKDKQTDKALEK